MLQQHHCFIINESFCPSRGKNTYVNDPGLNLHVCVCVWWVESEARKILGKKRESSANRREGGDEGEKRRKRKGGGGYRTA